MRTFFNLFLTTFIRHIRIILLISNFARKYVLLLYAIFTQFCNKFMCNFIQTSKLIFCLLSSDTLAIVRLFYLLIFVLRFYGCCHPCLENTNLLIYGRKYREYKLFPTFSLSIINYQSPLLSISFLGVTFPTSPLIPRFQLRH